MTKTTTIIKKKNTFRISALRFFLTFSQVPPIKLVDFKEIERRILYSQDIKNGIIAREKHQDGNTHFHIYLEYKKKKDVRRHDYFDFIFDHHGKYESCKSKQSSIKYITKDLDYFLIGDLKSFSSTSLVEDFIRKKVTEGFAVEDFFSLKDNSSIDRFVFDSGYKISRYAKTFQQFQRNQRIDKLRFIKQFNINKIQKCDIKLFPGKRKIIEICKYLNDNVASRNYKTPMLHV